ncbi:PAS domain S-box protein [Devosia aurantiaca]|uniref:PAS domain S-box protein n=1 Tax=Devosia aurantiaca TaxID=2714858 RepID=A0A6M1SRT0_9HYPH|nr:PAS domain S-box protein [Devosia aurantiaca]
MTWRISEDLIVVCGLDGFYRSVNPAWTTALGYTEAELIGMRSDTLVHPEDLLGLTDQGSVFFRAKRCAISTSASVPRMGNTALIPGPACPKATSFMAPVATSPCARTSKSSCAAPRRWKH